MLERGEGGREIRAAHGAALAGCTPAPAAVRRRPRPPCAHRARARARRFPRGRAYGCRACRARPRAAATAEPVAVTQLASSQALLALLLQAAAGGGWEGEGLLSVLSLALGTVHGLPGCARARRGCGRCGWRGLAGAAASAAGQASQQGRVVSRGAARCARPEVRLWRRLRRPRPGRSEAPAGTPDPCGPPPVRVALVTAGAWRARGAGHRRHAVCAVRASPGAQGLRAPQNLAAPVGGLPSRPGAGEPRTHGRRRAERTDRPRSRVPGRGGGRRAALGWRWVPAACARAVWRRQPGPS